MRRERTARHLHHAHRVFSRDKLWSSSLPSISVRPRHGRINARSPVIKCERFSFVETCAVKRQRRKAAAVNSVSGVAERKLPPSAKKTRACPSCIAWIERTVSRP